MTIFTRNSQEMLNALERKGLKPGTMVSTDEFLVINQDQYYSLPEQSVERAARMYREEGEVIKDLSRNCCIGDVVDLL